MSNYTPENYAQKILRDDMYSGLLTGDHTRATTKTLLDPEYAFVYSQNLYSHLSRLMPAKPQGILDISLDQGLFPGHSIVYLMFLFGVSTCPLQQ